MLIRNKPIINSSEITSESVYLNRRNLLHAAGLSGISLLPNIALSEDIPSRYQRLENISKSSFSTDAKKTSFVDVTTYNNFYEFGTGKGDPASNSGKFKPQPWAVTIDGEAEVTGTFTYEDILKPHALEERIYRMRCVEAWSMVVPWVGISLGDLLKRFQPTSKAKYVTFETVERPSEMPGQKRPLLDWPYREALRIDEAMHPLTILAVGVYGVELPNQNGAPLRLIVPWKYGFKGSKSIVRISFTEKKPYTSWNDLAPGEYGFYANVNPEVDHPRWSQARERPIGGGFFSNKVPTLMFNGYADQVANLYTGMDLTRYY
ncbi:MAG: protein-methionine-sulfoxide reductase catalytic subunit MsrP [Gammaproteobacteria bacterium]|nr:protein-methionine-sulfoxide reductase catalytic subunit MsrP [Gammaproteobacteria bacterium]MCP4089041.1 protein-methionine-sulfoxide reductase catalytic subunit MsrP [Gammaproteobacteria bacterium]